MSLTIRPHVRSLSLATLGEPPWEAPRAPRGADLPSTCDIAVAGAGLTGLFAACALAADGHDVVVFDRAFGNGASARSGGVVLGDTLVGYAPAFDGCEDALREWIGARGVQCGLAWRHCLRLVRDAALPSTPIDWCDGGRVRLAEIVNGGVLNPAQLLEGVAAEGAKTGVRLVNGAAMETFEPESRGVRVHTSRGELRARHLVIALDATLAPGTADPWDERAITVAIATEPLAAGALEALGLRPHVAFYTDDLPLLWGRVLPDGSLLLGRELVHTTFDAPAERLAADVSAAGARLLERARGLHPALTRVALARAWGGPVARTSAGLPIVRGDEAVPDTTWAGGYGGHGIAQAFRVGGLVAERLRTL